MSADYDLSEFATWLRSWGAAEATIQSRVSVLAAMIRRLGPPGELTEEAITGWLSSPEWSDWTRVAYHSHVRSLFEWMRKAGHRTDDPTLDIRRPKTPKTLPRPLSADELERVLATATGHLRTWLLLGVYAGLRAFEIAKLDGQDVTAESIHVIGKGGKRAMVPTHPVLWELAQSYPRRGPWFPGTGQHGHVNSKTITIRTTALFQSLGITGSHHRARHTYGTTLLRNGANIRVVQELMRHESLSSTEIYTQVADDEKRRAILGLAA